MSGGPDLTAVPTADLVDEVNRRRRLAANTHAAWCTADPARCDGTECHYHPDSLDLPAALETARASAHGEGAAYVGLSIARLLNPEFRYGAVPEADTCSIGIGLGKRGFGAEDIVELTVSEASELARRLSELCSMADADAQVVRGGAS